MAENNRKTLKIWYDEFEIAHDAFDYNHDDCKEFSYWITQFFMGKWYECKRKRVKTYVKYNLKRLEFVTKQKLNGGKGGLQSAENKHVDNESLASTLASENASGLASGLASLTTTTTITNTTTTTPSTKFPFKEIEFKILWHEWKMHRLEKHNPLTPSSERKALQVLFEESGGDCNTAMKAINKAIASGHVSLNPKAEFKPNQQNTEETPKIFRRATKQY